MLRGRKEHVCGDECTDREREISVMLEWSPQMLEQPTLWNRGGADTEAEDSEEVLRAEVG